MGKALELMGRLGKTVARQLFIGTGIPLVAGIAKRAVFAHPGSVALAVGGAAAGAGVATAVLSLPLIAATAALGAVGYIGYLIASWVLGKAVKTLRKYQEVKKRAGVLGAALPG